uniref:kinesin-like protein klp-3 n=1 Tax=Pristiophorus japonicus TaxID=55135 RepID=UPI00398E4D7C
MGSGATKPQVNKPQDMLVTIENSWASPHCSSENRHSGTIAVNNSAGTDMNSSIQTHEQLNEDQHSPEVSQGYGNAEDEEQEEIERLYQCAQSTAETSLNVHSSENNNPEADGLTLTFENFHHNAGTLYTCITQNNVKLYLDETKGFVPFPEKWYKEGNFIDTLHEIPTSSADTENKPNLVASYLTDERHAGGLWVPGKGMVMTCTFEERTNVCKYFDTDCGAWLILPLQWEMNLDFIRSRVDQVKHSNTAVENLHEKARELLEENRRQSEMIQHRNRKVAELEVDCKEALDRVMALQKISRTSDSIPIPPGSLSEPKKLLEIYKFTRELNISNRQLRSIFNLKLSEISHLIKQLVNLVLKLKNIEAGSTQEIEDLRSLYKKEASQKKLLYNKLQELCGNIRIFCRCRQDPGAQAILEFPSDEEISVNQNGNRKWFSFDKVYPPTATQEQVFEGTLPIITSCVDGYNVCIVAYGQTGSGKTYTMMGNEGNPGVNIRSIRELFRICQERKNIKYTTKITMLEIYNEAIQDLLSKQPHTHLEIMTQGKSVSIPGLREIEVKTESDFRRVMQLGNKNRTVVSTEMNSESSHSHLILTLCVIGMDSVSGARYHGTLTLCDLAGSEHISKTEATGQRLVEAAAINKSLTALRQVFTALKNNALHVPYRNSKLTQLLQPALSRDAKACIFVNISPNIKNLGETLSTLQLASSVRQVILGKAAQHLTTAKPSS